MLKLLNRSDDASQFATRKCVSIELLFPEEDIASLSLSKSMRRLQSVFECLMSARLLTLGLE